MKLFLKRTCLFYAYNTLAIFAGELSASIPGILLRAVFEMDAYTTQSYLVYGIGCYLFTVSILLFLMHRDIYENRKFTFTTVVLPAITVCVIRWLIWYITNGKAAFWVTGGATFFSPILFPDVSFEFLNKASVLCDLITTIICDVLITLPAFLLSGYWGYRHRINENKKMIQEHEEKTK